MERLTLRGLSDIRRTPQPAALWSGRRLRLDAYSLRAERYASGRFELGRSVRSLFPEREARAAIATMEAAMDTGQEAVLRQRLWRWVTKDGLPADIVIVATPTYDDPDARPVGVLTTVSRACSECPGLCAGHEDPRLVRAEDAAEPGAMAAFLRATTGMSVEDAVALARIRMAARDAFVEAAGPLVEEIRQRRAAPAGLGSHLRYPQRRPS